MSEADFWTVVEQIRSGDARYSREAYAFVMQALELTVRDLPERRHVTAEELLAGMCRHARGRYGLLAHTVLTRWGLSSGSDVGEVVYHLIDAGILSRREDDSRADFDRGGDLRMALEDQYFEETPPGWKL